MQIAERPVIAVRLERVTSWGNLSVGADEADYDGRLPICSFSFVSFSVSLVTVVASASVGSCRSAVSSWLRQRATLSSS